MAREIDYRQVLAVMQNMSVVCRESRRLHGWSRRELARRAGVSSSVVNLLENNDSTMGITLNGASAILAALLEGLDERDAR